MFTVFKVTVNLRGVFWGKQYSALCIDGKYINVYIIGELIHITRYTSYDWFNLKKRNYMLANFHSSF